MEAFFLNLQTGSVWEIKQRASFNFFFILGNMPDRPGVFLCARLCGVRLTGSFGEKKKRKTDPSPESSIVLAPSELSRKPFWPSAGIFLALFLCWHKMIRKSVDTKKRKEK